MDTTYRVTVADSDLSPDLLDLLLIEALDRLAAEIRGPFVPSAATVTVVRSAA